MELLAGTYRIFSINNIWANARKEGASQVKIPRDTFTPFSRLPLKFTIQIYAQANKGEGGSSGFDRECSRSIKEQMIGLTFFSSRR